MTEKQRKPIRGLPSDWEVLADAMSGRRLGPVEARAYLAGFHAGWTQGSFHQYLSNQGVEGVKTLRRAYAAFLKANPEVESVDA